MTNKRDETQVRMRMEIHSTLAHTSMGAEGRERLRRRGAKRCFGVDCVLQLKPGRRPPAVSAARARAEEDDGRRRR
jgi:tRNA A37 threonylcarbamoyladenosine dehydratase